MDGGVLSQLSVRGKMDFKELFNISPLAMYTCDAKGNITSFNEAAALLWGLRPKMGENLWCGSWKSFYTDGTPMPLDQSPMALTVKQGVPIDGEIIIQRPDLSLRNLLVFPRPLFDKDLVLEGAFNTLVDITSQKTWEEKQSMLSAIVESSDDAIVSKTLGGIITSWNKGAEKIFGYTESEIVGQSINKLIPPLHQHEEEIIISNIKAGNRIDHFQTMRIAKSGKEIPVSITVSPIIDHHGNIIGASKIARDISEQLNKEKQLTQIAQRLQILNNIGKTIAENLDVQKILQKVTDASTQITGAAFGAFFYNQINDKGESFLLFTLSGAAREDFEKFGMPRNTAVFHETFSGRGIVRVDDITKDPRYGKNSPHQGMPKGHLPVVSYLAVPVVSPTGNVIGGLFFGHPEPGVFTQEHEDLVAGIASQSAIAIDNSKLFEEVRALNEKKDEFIAMASHELKTPLTTVKGYLQILQAKQSDELSKLFIEKSLKQVNRLNALASDLFEISKIEAGKLQLYIEEFDLKKLVAEVIDTFKYIHESHKIILEPSDQSYMVAADIQRIEQVIINLLTNAIKYSPDNNTVFVSLQQSPDHVMLSVKDNGIGLSEDQQEKVFSRFYRVMGNSNISGLGLGLHISKEIVDRHHGEITLTSELGKGSVFSFSIPRTSK